MLNCLDARAGTLLLNWCEGLTCIRSGREPQRSATKIPLTPIISPPTECTTGKEMLLFSANPAHIQVPSKALAANLIGKTSHPCSPCEQVSTLSANSHPASQDCVLFSEILRLKPPQRNWPEEINMFCTKWAKATHRPSIRLWGKHKPRELTKCDWCATAQREVRFKNTLLVIKYTHINAAALTECKSPALKGCNYCPASSMFMDALQPPCTSQ